MSRIRVALSFVVSVLVAGCAPTNTKTTAVRGEESVKRFNLVISQYLDLHKEGHWLLTTNPQQPTDVMGLSQSLSTQVSSVLEIYADVSPETEEIFRTFRNPWVSFSNGVGSFSIATKGGASPTLEHNKSIEVCFFAKEDYPNHPATLYYRAGWKAVMISATAWPSGLLAAELYHELGHALADKKGFASARASQDSDEYIAEEVAMHELEAVVLNAASKGGYFAKLDAILKREEVSSPKEVRDSVTLEDLRALDRDLGCEKVGPEAAGVLLDEHFLVLGMRYIDTHLPVDQRLEAKIELYRWLRQETR